MKPEHLRPIFEASNEAFRDHWGARDESEEEYQLHMEEKIFHPELWMVAWEGDQIASVIHNFYNADENEEYQRKRGYTEGICTRRPWRKRGIARALLVRSMQMFKEMGMTETALGVDSGEYLRRLPPVRECWLSQSEPTDLVSKSDRVTTPHA